MVIFLVRRDILHILHQIQQFENLHILRFDTIMVTGRLVAAVDNHADVAIEECLQSIIEAPKRDDGPLILVHNGNGCLLKCGQHRPLSTAHVLARKSTFPNFIENALKDGILIRRKGVVVGKIVWTTESLDVLHLSLELEEIFQNRSVFFVVRSQ